MAEIRILITGGSGFIGTNAVQAFVRNGWTVCNLDIKEPINQRQQEYYRPCDILDRAGVQEMFTRYKPTHVLHLAARTDLHERSHIEKYCVNFEGTQNVAAAASQCPSVICFLLASSKLAEPVSNNGDASAWNTLYGQSKYMAEQALREKNPSCSWCIARLSSIWGPWADVPYGRFFHMVARGRYVHPGRCEALRSFGYVGNLVYQFQKVLKSNADTIHGRLLYLSDYEPFTIRQWADMISMKLHGRRPRTIPMPIVRCMAWAGDAMKQLGMPEPPFSSFRLRNMMAHTADLPLEAIKRITGPLPYSLETAVDETIAWMKDRDGKS
ncbi:MAG: NAD(P)-dependent oxidoreductase [Sedimentisphaerales bacterium]|nr:NAD(P)-dependent oxidoreductase [Sedimentisphaerales bacterium]